MHISHGKQLFRYERSDLGEVWKQFLVNWYIKTQSENLRGKMK